MKLFLHRDLVSAGHHHLAHISPKKGFRLNLRPSTVPGPLFSDWRGHIFQSGKRRQDKSAQKPVPRDCGDPFFPTFIFIPLNYFTGFSGSAR